MRRLPLAIAAVSLGLALVAGGVAGWSLVSEARAAAGREVAAAAAMVRANPAVIPALESLQAVESATLHDAGGKLIGEYRRGSTEHGLAARIAPAEVACDTAASGTLCIESSPAAVAPAVRTAVRLVTIVPLAAALVGFLVGRLLAAAGEKRTRRMAETIDRATHEKAWSLRLDAQPGELDRLSAAVNGLLSEMQDREIAIRRRTLEIEAVNKDLESFAYSVSHDLRAPLGSIDGFTQALEMDYGDTFDDTAREYLGWIKEACRQMRELIDGMLQMSRLTKLEVERQQVDLSSIARSIAESLRQSSPERPISFEIRDGVRAVGDERLLRAVLENLMANAWKFTRKRDDARIEFGAAGDAYYVRDNGAGFDPSHAAKMFRPFQRLHSSREFEGTGIGLATVQKIIERHGGRAWAEGEVGKGATIYFTTA
jgi:signal transduction histidine kinase